MNENIKQGISRIREMNLIPYVAIFYGVGFIGLLFPFSRPFFTALVPFSLLISMILILLYHGPVSRKQWLTFGLIWLAGFLIELAGVNTGFPFGEYRYGATLGPRLAGTPVIIGLNWLMLIYAVTVMTSPFTTNIYFRAVFASVSMVVYDFVLEPAAIRLDMWNWDMVAVPMQNYLAWLLVSFVFSWISMRSGLVNNGNRMARAVFLIQFTFFLALDIANATGKLWAF